MLLLCAACWAMSPASARAQTETADSTPLIPPAEEAFPSLQLRGFTDVNYSFADPGGFQLGQFVLHFTSRLAKKVSFFGEFTATPHEDNFAVEVERSFIRYDYNDAFKVSFGRYHTPIGYWNTAYHHGLWLQTTIRRPEYIKFGSTFVPVHFVGAVAEGRIPSGMFGLGYSAGVGNGRGEVESRAGDAGDVNHNRAWITQLTSRPTGKLGELGMEAGAALYRDQIGPPGGVGSPIEEWIGSGYAALTRESPELIFEYVLVRHESDGLRNDRRAYYGQAAWRLPGRLHMAKPYGRYEQIQVDDLPALAVIDGTADAQIVTAGLRLDLIPLAALKTEYRNELAADGARLETMLFQMSFTF
jgi:hypothetical protein